MFHKVSKIIKICAYIFLFGNIFKEAYGISVQTSYLNTGKLMGVESMMMMLWSCFHSFLFAAIIYGAGEIIEYYEKAKEKKKNENESDDLTK